jgi:hypothetical protein
MLLCGFMFFRLALDISYEKFLYVVFKFDTPINFWYNVSIGRYLLSLVIFFIFTTIISSRPKDIANVFLFMAAFFLVGPLTSEYGLNAGRPIEPVLYTITALFVVDLSSRLPLPDLISRLPVPGGPRLAVATSVLGVLYLIVWAYVSGAFHYFNVDVRHVYDYRDKVAELLDRGALSYLNLWVYKVFTIFLVCVCLHRRNWLGLILVLAAQMVFFGLTSHRIVLFLPFLAIAIWLYLDRFDQLAPMPLAAGAGLLVALFLFEARGIESVAEIAIRRAFFVPSGLTFQWFDYFTFHPHVYWADKLLAGFSHSEYTRVNLPRLMGDYFVPGSDSAANTGMVPAGFAQAGVWGVALYAVVLGLVLSLLNTIVKSGVPLWLVAALTIGPLRTALADSDLFTSLLSHGVGLSVVLLWLYRGQMIRHAATPEKNDRGVLQAA